MVEACENTRLKSREARWSARLKRVALAGVLGLLSACGGGGGGSGSPPAPAVAPTITLPPASVSVALGQTATFSVQASGTAPLAFQWQRNGAAISGATSASYTTPPAAAQDDGTAYSVTVSNVAGSANSAPVQLSVIAAPVAPAITASPANVSVVEGGSASFSVTATGSGPLQYQWLRNGVDIPGAQASTYILGATTLADDGAAFSVRVTNVAGTATSGTATLAVSSSGAAPTIVAQPQPLTLPAGAVASFSVAARGGPFTYQWRRNGVDIPGATGSSHTTAAATPGDNGAEFTVSVRNGAISTTSAPAALTVIGAVAFPSTRITIVVPTAPGNSFDLAARDLALALSEDQGWTVIVDNRPGGNGTTGMALVLGAAADGHTLLFGNNWMATASTFYRRLAYDPIGDFEHLGGAGHVPMIMTGALALPSGTYPALASWIDSRPAGSVRIGHAGLGSRSHLCALLFAHLDGTVLTQAAYAGPSLALSDLFNGQIDLYCDDAMQAHIEAGRVRPYGVSALERSALPALAGIPTLDESGLTGFDATDWHGLHAPRGTPAAVIARLNAALRTAMVNPGYLSRRANAGARAAIGPSLTPAGHRAFIQAEAGKWRPLIQAAGQYLD